MNRIKNLIAFGAFSLLLLGLPAIASAQWRDRDRDDDYDRGNRGGYGRNNGGYYNQNLNNVIRNLERRASRFEDQMDRVDRGGRGRGDNLERLSDDFVNAAKRLNNRYDDRGDFNRSRNEAQRVLSIGSEISRSIGYNNGRRSGYGYGGYGEWNGIENDLRVIANAYGLYYDGGYNNNRGGGRRNRGGGGGGWFPF